MSKEFNEMSRVQFPRILHLIENCNFKLNTLLDLIDAI